MVILYDNAMLVAFIVTNVIPNSIFAPIAPVRTMREIMMAHPGLNLISIILTIPIVLPNQIQIKIKTQTQLETLQQHPYGSTFVQMTTISS